MIWNDSEQTHRFVLRAMAPNGESRTLIGWRTAVVVNGLVLRRVVLTLDTTFDTAVVLTPAQAESLAASIANAART